MKRTILSFVGIIAALSMLAQDPVLMTVNGKDVRVSEFMYIYQKNNQEGAIDHQSIDEHIDLVAKLKLKVAEAEAQGIDTTESFKREFASYRAQATPKYMQDNQAIDSLVRMSYEHMRLDRRAAHIAIQCPKNASEEMVDSILQKLEDARARVLGTKTEVRKGKRGRTTIVTLPAEDFAAVAREVSTDPSVEENGGELGWITPFRYVWPFEKAVYETPVGQVTPIFRTAYGFHFALVEEEREHQEVHAAHIMKMVARDDSTQRDAKKLIIDSIAQLLTTDNFAAQAKRLSDDKGSAMRGGDLGWFGAGMMVKPFEDAAFSLEPGQISEPIESRFGWHIIYLMDRRGIQPLDSMYQQIERNVKRDERMEVAEQAFIRRARAEYGLGEEVSDEEVKQVVDSHLEEKYPELAHLVQEYYDGLLMFEVSLREVWDKASKDEEGLTRFFAQNRKQYTWDAPRYKGWLIQCRDKESLKAAQAIIKNSNPDSIESYLRQRINTDSIVNVKAQRGLWVAGANSAVDKYGFKQKGASFTPSEELPYVICVGRVIKKPEVYQDERGKVITDYQDFLECEWVKRLREKYDVVIYPEVVEQLKKQ